MTKNMQSAEEAYKELEKVKAQNEQFAADLKAAQEKLQAMEKLNQESNLQVQLDAKDKIISEQADTIRGLQDINQQLFLKVGAQVDEKPVVKQEEVEHNEILKGLAEKMKKTDEYYEKNEQ